MIPLPRHVRTRAVRRIAADPTSTALLLAGPTAVDLWPGVRRTGDGRDGVEVEAPIGDAPARLTVRALPPRRSPTSYVTRFAWSGDDVPGGSGRLTLAYAPTSGGTPLTQAVLEVDVDDDAPYVDLHRAAEVFLENLAAAAERRNSAA